MTTMEHNDRTPPELTSSLGQASLLDLVRFLGSGPGHHSYNDRVIDVTESSQTSLRDYIEMIMRRKRTAATVFLVVALLAILITVLSTPIYKSEAALEIEKETGMSLGNLGNDVAQNIGLKEDEVFATQVGILKGRALAEALLDRMKLGESVEFTSKGVLQSLVGWVSAKVKLLIGSEGPDENAVRNLLVEKILDRVTAHQEGKGRLLYVGIEAKDPAMAQAMLQNYVGLYLEKNLVKRRRVSAEAGAWLVEELKRAENKAIESMAALIEFTRKHGMVSLEDENNHILKFFNKTAEMLVQSKQNRVAYEALQKSSGRGVTVFPQEVKTPDTEGLHTKLSLLESEYAQMVEIYSPKNPRVILLKKQIDFLQGRIRDVQKGLVEAVVETAKAQEKFTEEAFDSAKKEALDSTSLGTKYAVLKKGAETSEEIFKILLRKSKELQVSTQVIGNNIVTITPPSLPSWPARPRTALILIIGCILGLMLAITAVLIQEHLDTSVTGPDEGDRIGLPSLGMVPGRKYLTREHSFTDFTGPAELYAYEYPTSSISEAIKNVKTSMVVTFAAHPCSSLLIASALPGEGKTFLVISLGSVFCSRDKRVLLVEADLRRPRLSSVFGHGKAPEGLVNLLNGDNKRGIEGIVRSTSVPDLYYIPAGELPRNPVELLESDRLAELMGELTSQFDLVLVDSPPVIGCSDARILARVVDSIILTVKQGTTPLDFVRRAAALITIPNGGQILGHVLNDVTPRFSYYSHYGYQKKYSYSLPKYTRG